MKLSTLLDRSFMETKWYCGYRILSDQEMKETAVPQRDRIYSYHVVDIPNRYWIADPFLMAQGGITHLFFEYMDCYKSKAVLAEIPINPDGKKPQIVYEFSGHTSYPCLFEYNDQKYMIPETAYSNSLQLLKCRQWPARWEKVGDLLTEKRVADCTPFYYEGKLYIFIYENNRGSHEHGLYLGELDIDTCSIQHLHLIKHYDGNLGRPGGHVFKDNGRYIRVVQPATHFYGEKLEFYEFSICNGKYEETKIEEFLPSQVTLDRKVNIAGIHTFNRCGNIEVIDIQPVRSFHFFRPFRLALQIMGIGCFGRYDKKQKYLNGKAPAHKT